MAKKKRIGIEDLDKEDLVEIFRVFELILPERELAAIVYNRKRIKAMKAYAQAEKDMKVADRTKDQKKKRAATQAAYKRFMAAKRLLDAAKRMAWEYGFYDVVEGKVTKDEVGVAGVEAEVDRN